MTNNKKYILVSILWVLISNAYAVNVDTGLAARSAFLTIVVIGALAVIAFQLISYNLTRKTISTPVDGGRWIGAWFAAIAISSSGNFYDGLTAQYFYRLSLITIPLMFVGFVIGFIWKKVKGNSKVGIVKTNINNEDDEKLWEQASAELNSSNKNEGLWAKCFAEANGDEAKARAQYLSAKVSKLRQEEVKPNILITNKPVISKYPLRNPLIYVVALVIIGGVLFLANSNNSVVTKKTKDITYNVYGCKDKKATSENCDRDLESTIKIQPSIETQKVIIEWTNLLTMERQESIYNNCKVIDDKNWSCGEQLPIKAPKKIGDDFIPAGNHLSMKNGEMSGTGLTLSFYSNGKLTATQYIPAWKYVLQK